MKYARPWYRKSKAQWFVQINGKQIPLGKGKREAMRAYHRLMDKGPATGELPVRKLLDAYLTWLKANRAESTVTRRKPLLASFGNSLRPSLRIRDLKGFHVEPYLNENPRRA
jgi:hypothetical protein